MKPGSRWIRLDKQKLYLEALGVTLSASLFLLAAFKVESLEIYLIIFTLVYTAFTVLFGPRRRWHDVPGILLFAAFCWIVALRIIDILIL